MQIIEKTLEELKPYKNNPRNNDDAVPYVMESIKQFGFKVPIIIDSNNEIVCGHTRFKASQKLGLKKVPCIIADDLTDEQIKAFRLADNKVSEQAKWDSQKLGDELSDLFNIIDMNDFGFPIQIENICQDCDGDEKIAVELGEANNYVVLEFFNENDWDVIQDLLGIERQCTNEDNKKMRRHGLGRVIDGRKVIDLLKGGKNEN